MKMLTDVDYMKIALEEAQKAAEKDEVPVGAVVVFSGQIFGRAHNEPIGEHDPSVRAQHDPIAGA
jgi:tRNA(adenine34) deaminase